MLAFLKGVFVHKTPAVVQVDVNGVGYEVQISLNTYSNVQSLERGLLLTHLHIQEDRDTLYAFFGVAQTEMFLLLLSVSGVGAATARRMLPARKPEEITGPIRGGNARALARIQG